MRRPLSPRPNSRNLLENVACDRVDAEPCPRLNLPDVFVTARFCLCLVAARSSADE